MRIERDSGGDDLLEPDELAPKLCLSADELRRRMKSGLVTSLVEAGQGENVGSCRLTVRSGGQSSAQTVLWFGRSWESRHAPQIANRNSLLHRRNLADRNFEFPGFLLIWRSFAGSCSARHPRRQHLAC